MEHHIHQGPLVFIGLYIILSVLLDSGAVMPRGLLFVNIINKTIQTDCVNVMTYATSLMRGQHNTRAPTRAYIWYWQFTKIHKGTWSKLEDWVMLF